MKMSLKASVLALGIAATAGMVLPLAVPAGAALKSSVTCKTETSPKLNPKSQVISTVGNCTPAALKAGGSSTTHANSGQNKGTSTSTTTWKGGKGTTTAKISYAPAKTKGKCKAPYDSRITITGKVTKATGAAKSITKVGEPVTASICAITKAPNVGKTTIEPGTLFKL